MLTTDEESLVFSVVFHQCLILESELPIGLVILFFANTQNLLGDNAGNIKVPHIHLAFGLIFKQKVKILLPDMSEKARKVTKQD